jgi:hypothetical protein
VLLIQGVVDTYYLPPMQASLAVSARVDVVGPTVDPLLVAAVAGAGGAQRDAPLSSNRAVDGGFVTLGATQFAALPGEDGHFVVFDQGRVQSQYVCWFETAAKGAPTVVAPFDDPSQPCP